MANSVVSKVLYPLRRVYWTQQLEVSKAWDFRLDCGHHVVLAQVKGRMPKRLRCVMCYCQ